MGDLQVPWDRIWEKMKLKSNIFLLVLVSLDLKKKISMQTKLNQFNKKMCSVVSNQQNPLFYKMQNSVLKKKKIYMILSKIHK